MTDNEYKGMIYNMFARIVGCAFESYNFYHQGVDELTYEAGFYMKLMIMRFGFLVNFGEKSVYSEAWMLDDTGKCVRV